jgi:hypothetical protein
LYQVQNILKTFNSFIIGTNHNGEYYGGQKSFMSLKLENFTSCIVDDKLEITIDHSYLRI